MQIEIILVAQNKKLGKLHAVTRGNSKLMYCTEHGGSKGMDVGIVRGRHIPAADRLRISFCVEAYVAASLLFSFLINLGPLLVV